MPSSYLHKALLLLESTKGRPLSMEERGKLSIELAQLMLQEASRSMTGEERRMQKQLSRLMIDPLGKPFTLALTDQCFRSKSNLRIAERMISLFKEIGIPSYLSPLQRAELHFFGSLSPSVAQFLVPVAIHTLRKETSRVIIPGEPSLLQQHIIQRRKEGVRLNINHLGEAILSEEEAKRRLQIYLDDLAHPMIDYISIKISTLFSQINLLDFEGSLATIKDRLRLLYRTAAASPVLLPDGSSRARVVNLDMEEYRDLHLTVAVFRELLDEEEFFHYSAGIVLQAYLPDSHDIQKELTEWAMKRVAKGGAPIRLRIVKGANLAMEQVEASLKEWPQAPYTNKQEVDANYKRMLLYGTCPEHVKAVRLGIASHNLFDLAFAMLLRSEQEVEHYVGFEMLEGMADHIRRVVQRLTGDILLYCPVAKKEDFEHAIAYLIRRLDENTGGENFLRHLPYLEPGSEIWHEQSQIFLQSCGEIEAASLAPRRTQNRLATPPHPDFSLPFENEPDTDFSLPQNHSWAQGLAQSWGKKRLKDIPAVIDGEEILTPLSGTGYSPSNPTEPLFSYVKAGEKEIERAFQTAKKAAEEWGKTSVLHRSHLVARAAHILRERRGELIGAMMLEGGKTILEADPEVSEAIDFAEYYRRQMVKWSEMKDIAWEPKGVVLVASPWNFPCAIPAGGILASLMAGNAVLFKPASDTLFVGWTLVNALWEAGIPKNVLQFVPCSGEEGGKSLICHSCLDCVVLTGGTETARNLLALRPGLDLAAETGGKNAMIVTAMADRDLAIKEILHSAFSHSGQKCSATSLLILEKEVFDDPNFRRAFAEAASSIRVGSPFDLGTKMGPLIHPPRGPLLRALTTLEPGEEWLVEPKADPNNPCLWSPGIKWNVRPGSFTHMTELFGPVLAVLRAKDLEEAIFLANAVPYGLTSGLQSLDEREQALWLEKIEAGNLYINRGTTGAIVRRQPFGGTKASSYGRGSKAGGPNYLCELMRPKEVVLPQEKAPINERVNELMPFLEKLHLTAEELGLWTASIASYAYWWKRLQQKRDPTKIVGQDNYFGYLPRKRITLRLLPHSKPLDVLRTIAAALTCGAGLEVSFSFEEIPHNLFDWLPHIPHLSCVEEKNEAFLARVGDRRMERIRLLDQPLFDLQKRAALAAIPLITVPVLSNGRLELLNFLREVSISMDYHRYGNLGAREGELRRTIL
ncbi:MAG: proline dehydrogenase family protein [Verrucomicrobiota bacterium]|nr:proline dehydrogenase family protein [Verrucomicrobiota bacterium]